MNIDNSTTTIVCDSSVCVSNAIVSPAFQVYSGSHWPANFAHQASWLTYANEAILVAARTSARSNVFICIQLLIEYKTSVHLLIHQRTNVALYILFVVSTFIDECTT